MNSKPDVDNQVSYACSTLERRPRNQMNRGWGGCGVNRGWGGGGVNRGWGDGGVNAWATYYLIHFKNTYKIRWHEHEKYMNAC